MKTGNSNGTTEPRVLGHVAFVDGRGDLPMLQVTTPWSTAEMYLHGAHVTHFQKNKEPPLLFLSQCSRFAPGQAIRGGIPIVFPWFGPREGLSQHGFARVVEWELKEFAPAADGSVSIRFRLPECPEAGGFPPFTADYVVTVNQTLRLQLIVKNESKEHEFLFEDCLHTYLAVNDVTAVSIKGLAGVSYLDKTTSFLEKEETSDAIRIRLGGGPDVLEHHRSGGGAGPAPGPAHSHRKDRLGFNRRLEPLDR